MLTAMPVLDARALEIDPEGMALLAGVLRSGRPARPLGWPSGTHEAAAIVRERLDDEPEPRELRPALIPAE